MSRIATATLQTPWDCKWSRFGRMRTAGPNAPAEGLWVCVYPDGTTRRPIGEAECETCDCWEYNAPLQAPARGPSASVATAERAPIVAACPRLTRTEKRLDLGIRVVALALAVVFAATGFVVLTRPLAIPLTISLWAGAVTCFLLGVWGNFNRRTLPERSW